MTWIEDQSGAAAARPGADETAALPTEASAEIPPEITAQSLGEYFRGWLVRIRSGDAGVLPVVAALIIVFVGFYLLNNTFLSASNLVNLLEQSAVVIMLAMGMGFVLLLGDIDLSVGFVAGIGGAVAAILVQPTYNMPWFVAIAAAVAFCALYGLVQGVIITQLRLPSFVVTLAGFLVANGLLLMLLGNAGEAPLNSTALSNVVPLHGIVATSIPDTLGWAGLVVILVVFAPVLFLRDESRRRSGLVAPPIGLTILKIVLFAVAGFVLVWICSLDRGRFGPVTGMPWFVPIVLVMFLAWSILLEQTAFGRHIYAVGGNAEAARRAGINVNTVRAVCFALCSGTAALGGIIYASTQAGMTTNIQGGQLVLYAVAAAVIGGTSLFGGRGRVIHGILGGLVIGAISNGMYLLGYPLQQQLVVTGLVLLAAVTIDALSRRGATSGAIAR